MGLRPGGLGSPPGGLGLHPGGLGLHPGGLGLHPGGFGLYPGGCGLHPGGFNSWSSRGIEELSSGRICADRFTRVISETTNAGITGNIGSSRTSVAVGDATTAVVAMCPGDGG